MRNLLIQSWHRNHALKSLPFPSDEVLLERLRPAAELTNQALARLVLRLRAGYPVSVPLRADADAATLVPWLTEAGAVVGVSTPPLAFTASSPEPPCVLAATNASAASSSPQESDDRTE